MDKSQIRIILTLLTLALVTACTAPATRTPVPTATRAPVTLTPTPAPNGYPRVVRLYSGEQWNDRGTAVASVGGWMCYYNHDVTLELSPDERVAVEDARARVALAGCLSGMGIQAG